MFWELFFSKHNFGLRTAPHGLPSPVDTRPVMSNIAGTAFDAYPSNFVS